MFKNKSKSFIVSSVLVVFALVLAACQPMIASNEAEKRQRAIDAWAANYTAQLDKYYEEQGKSSVALLELKSDVPAITASTEAEKREKAIDAWAANYTAQLEKYYKELGQSSIAIVELKSDVPAGLDQMVDAYLPGITISQTRLVSGDFMTEYVVKSAGPGWIVFHADDDGEPGAVLRYVYVDGGTSKLVNIEAQGEIGAEARHVMLHEDKGTIGRFEFPGPDGPVIVNDNVINEMCLCNY
jgi:hypothetical protein